MEEGHSVRLIEGIDLKDLMSNGGATFQVNFNDDFKDDPEEYSYKPDELLPYVNPECCGLFDEDTYQEGLPFEKLATKMSNVLDNGKVKKRILREGYGTIVPEMSRVTIDYNAYNEHDDEPFDSTYLRKKPFVFQLGNGGTIPGLDIGVQTMKMNEKAQFLIQCDYAYGHLGCLDRVPPKATVLFEVELKTFVDSGAAIAYNQLDEERQNTFAEIYKYALGLCSKAKDLYSKNLVWPATKEYNAAVSKLETCWMKDQTEEAQQQNLLLRLYSNLLVAYTKLNEPRRACKNYNKIANLCKGNSLKPSAKVYFNHARSLMQLGEYNTAEVQLKKAHKLEPQNVEVTKEFKKLDKLMRENHERETVVARAMFANMEIKKKNTESSSKQITDEFKKTIRQLCEDLTKDDNTHHFLLPSSLTTAELEHVRHEVAKFDGLHLEEPRGNHTKKYFITKASNCTKTTD